jgi:hypothetical protein
MNVWGKGKTPRIYLRSDKEKGSAWVQQSDHGVAFEYRLSAWRDSSWADYLIESVDKAHGGDVFDAITAGLFSWEELLEINEGALGKEATALKTALRREQGRIIKCTNYTRKHATK